MADKAKKTVSANPLQVEFPRDEYQITQALKAEGKRAAGRVGTKKDKLKVLVDTLDILKAHAVERYKKAVEMEASAVESAKQRAAREAEAAEKAQKARVKQAVAEVASSMGVPVEQLEVAVKETK